MVTGGSRRGAAIALAWVPLAIVGLGAALLASRVDGQILAFTSSTAQAVGWVFLGLALSSLAGTAWGIWRTPAPRPFKALWPLICPVPAAVLLAAIALFVFLP